VRVGAIVQQAIRSGRLTRQPCAICGSKIAHAHHNRYDIPLDIVWLCQKHHTEEHLKKAEGK